MDILIKNMEPGDKKFSGIIELLSNYDVEYSVNPSVLQQTPCTALRENIVQLLTEEQQSALRNKRRYLTKVYHNENARALERILKMLDDRQPLA